MDEYKEMSFLSHLEELRWHLVRIFIAILLCGIFAVFQIDFIVDKILFGVLKNDFITYEVVNQWCKDLGVSPLFLFDDSQYKMINTNPYGQFSAYFWISCVAGIIISFPYIAFEIWRFIAPALKPEEKQNSRLLIGISAILFLLGVFFGYFIICPLTMKFLFEFSLSKEIVNQFQADEVVSVITTTCLGMGLVFLMPIIIYALTKLGVITPYVLTNNRKYAFVIIMIITAFISNDFYSNFIIIIPLLALFEISIIISKYVYHGQSKSAV